MIKTWSNRQPGFFWQGVLIILPAILLAGVGLYSLRQDRILAQHEATEQARKLTASLARDLLPKALQASSVSRAKLEQYRSELNRPEDDPIVAFASDKPSRIAGLASEAGDLIFPALRVNRKRPGFLPP